MEKRQAKRLAIIKSKGGKCKICGMVANSDNIATMELHHKTSATKIASVSWLLHNGTLEEAKKEASKCIVLCKACHNDLHKAIGKKCTIKQTMEYIKNN